MAMDKEQLVGETAPHQYEPATKTKPSTLVPPQKGRKPLRNGPTQAHKYRKLQMEQLEGGAIEDGYIHHELQGLGSQIDDLCMLQGTDHFTIKVPEYSNFITTGSSSIKFDVKFVHITHMIAQSDLDASMVRLWEMYQSITSRRQKSLFAVVDPFLFNITWLETVEGRGKITEFLCNVV
jgi:hypothetical protein